MPCSADDCDYVTPQNIPTYELVKKNLIHQNTVHTRRPEVLKTEELKRPVCHKLSGISSTTVEQGTSGKLDCQVKAYWTNFGLPWT